MKAYSETRPDESGDRSTHSSGGAEPTGKTGETNTKRGESERSLRVGALDELSARSGEARDTPESREESGAVRSPSLTGLQSDGGEGAHIPPWYILAGLGKLERAAVCDMLALFECFSVANKGIDQVRDWTRKRREGDGYQPAFERRVHEKSLELSQSDRTTDALRYELWCMIRERLGLSPALPLSTRYANARAAEIASSAEKYFKDETDGSRSEPLEDFSGIVRLQVRKVVIAALKGDGLSDEQRKRVEDEFRQRLHELPEELRDSSVEQAIRSGNWEIAASLLSAGSLAGLGVAVEVAGFGAYIIAAQASAIIPFLGGQAAVSTLAVVSNPLFVLPVLAGGFIVLNKGLKGKVLRPVASAAAVQLAVLGLAAGANGLQECLNGFKKLNQPDCRPAVWNRRMRVAGIAGEIKDTPGTPDVELPSIADTGLSATLTSVLFPERERDGTAAVAVAGAATADLLFDVAAIDPRVVAAADFSRVEDLGDIFRFGAFAEQIEGMGEAAHTGAESGLRGYLAEMMVATRLQGHEVSLPDTANNPGVDLFVDGHPFQVKCYGDDSAAMAALGEHFERFPDIPVYVNSEVIPAVRRSGEPWAESVFAVEGFDYETTNLVLEQSLAAGADLADLNIPIFAVAASAARNLHGWWKGSVPLSDIPTEILIDGAVHGGLSVAGGFTGAALGGLVFGPAGAVVFGGAGGIASLFGAGGVRGTLRRLFYRNWFRSVNKSVSEFESALKHAMRKKVVRKRAKIDQLESEIERARFEFDHRATESDSVATENLPGRLGSVLRRIWNWLVAFFPRKRREPAGPPTSLLETPNEIVAGWMRLKFEDQILCVAECQAEMWDLSKDPVERARELMRVMRESGVHPLSVKEEFAALCTVLSERRG